VQPGARPSLHARCRRSFKNRVDIIFKMTYMASNRDGQLHPAYARFHCHTGEQFPIEQLAPDNTTTDSALYRTRWIPWTHGGQRVR